MLEKKLNLELHHQIKALFLDIYLQENLLPKGLCFTLSPTFYDVFC